MVSENHTDKAWNVFSKMGQQKHNCISHTYDLVYTKSDWNSEMYPMNK
jgi:hypothetical protein